MKIVIFVDGNVYGQRNWKLVPRVGDEIMLEGKKGGIYRIERCVWFGDIDSSEPEVHLVVKDMSESLTKKLY